MTQEDKELLVKDLCARSLYGLMCVCGEYVGQLKSVCPDDDYCTFQNNPYAIETIKPYLRPMSSMTKEERIELGESLKNLGMTSDVKRLDWLLAHHFDIRNLIGKGLALEAPEGMYKID